MIDRLPAFLACLILEGARCFAKSLVVSAGTWDAARGHVSRFSVLLLPFDSAC